MQPVATVGLDIAKSVFQVHGIDAEENVIIRRKLKRRYEHCLRIACAVSMNSWPLAPPGRLCTARCLIGMGE